MYPGEQQCDKVSQLAGTDAVTPLRGAAVLPATPFVQSGTH